MWGGQEIDGQHNTYRQSQLGSQLPVRLHTVKQGLQNIHYLWLGKMNKSRFFFSGATRIVKNLEFFSDLQNSTSKYSEWHAKCLNLFCPVTHPQILTALAWKKLRHFACHFSIHRCGILKIWKKRQIPEDFGALAIFQICDILLLRAPKWQAKWFHFYCPEAVQIYVWDLAGVGGGCGGNVEFGAQHRIHKKTSTLRFMLLLFDWKIA